MFPQRVCYGSNSPSVTSALWLIPLTLNKVILFPIYTPRMIKGGKWSLPTVNNPKCLTENQFCVIQNAFPDAFIKTFYPFKIWNSWCDTHRLCVSRALKQWLQHNFFISSHLQNGRIGGTRGNSCLGRRFLWASRSGHIHKARQGARWDRAPIYWVWTCAYVHVPFYRQFYWQLDTGKLSGDIWF